MAKRGDGCVVTELDPTHVSLSRVALTRVPGSASELAGAVNLKRRERGLPPTCDRRTVAHWRAGRRRPDDAYRGCLEALWPDCTAGGWDVPAPSNAVDDRRGSQALHGAARDPVVTSDGAPVTLLDRVRDMRQQRATGGGQEGDIVDLGQVELLELRRAKAAALAKLSERDRLFGSPPYRELRVCVLGALPEAHPARSAVDSVLPPPPSGGALVELAAIKAELGELRGHVTTRIASTTGKTRTRFLLAHVRLANSIDEELAAAMTVDGQPNDVLKGLTAIGIVDAMTTALRPHVDGRVQVAAALRDGGPLCTAIAAALERIRHVSFPSEHYASDPVGFCRDVLGFEPWSRQQDILTAIRDHRRVSIRGAQKIGKSRILAAAALWWYGTRRDAKVLLSNSSGKQLERINWVEVSQLARESGRCLACVRDDPDGPRPCPHSQVIDGELLKSSAGGLTSANRSIFGATARDVEGLGGFSGAHLLIIVDESSSLSEEMAQAFLGNAGAKGAKFVMAGNPTKQSGPFFDSFHHNARHWKGVHVTALEAAEEDVPGLASMEQIEFIREQDERGEKSPFYQIRVMGNFPTREERSIYALEDIIAAQDPERYRAAAAEGRLVIGIDPAGASGLGDESCISVVRGSKVLELRTGRGWSADDHAEIVAGIVRDRVRPDEKPLVAIDADGVGGAIASRLEDGPTVEVVRVYLGQNARRWVEFDQVGDEAHDVLAKWLRHGGVFPGSPKLEQEMNVQTWELTRRRRGDREIEVRTATRKKEIRAILHRSPDRLDSLRVFAWGAYLRGVLAIPGAHEALDDPTPEADVTEPFDIHEEHRISVQTFDPYAYPFAGDRRENER